MKIKRLGLIVFIAMICLSIFCTYKCKIQTVDWNQTSEKENTSPLNDSCEIEIEDMENTQDVSSYLYKDFESTPEARREYYLPASAVSTPEEALKRLFNDFLNSLKAYDEERSFCISSVLSSKCELFDRHYIVNNPNQDWGYAANNKGCYLEDNQWVTFCSAVVTYSGSLSVYEESGTGGDFVRWGFLIFDGQQYVYIPTELGVRESAWWDTE